MRASAPDEARRPPRHALLFVDDDADLRELIRDAAISALGFERCVLAASFEEAAEQRDDVLGCSLAILDINLGWTAASGVDVYNWLQTEHFQGQVVFLTGHGEDDPRVRDAARIGDVPILLKPISMEVLVTLASDASGNPGSP
jgi:response regulator of citrate/malate metabolism